MMRKFPDPSVADPTYRGQVCPESVVVVEQNCFSPGSFRWWWPVVSLEDLAGGSGDDREQQHEPLLVWDLVLALHQLDERLQTDAILQRELVSLGDGLDDAFLEESREFVSVGWIDTVNVWDLVLGVRTEELADAALVNEAPGS